MFLCADVLYKIFTSNADLGNVNIVMLILERNKRKCRKKRKICTGFQNYINIFTSIRNIRIEILPKIFFLNKASILVFFDFKHARP